MATTKSSYETNEQIESEPFKLDLPAEIAIKPEWSIPLSPTRVALVYKNTDAIRNDQPTVRYEVAVLNPKTGSFAAFDNYSNKGFHHLYSLHELKHFLINTSRHLNIKKRTRKTTEVDETDDD